MWNSCDIYSFVNLYFITHLFVCQTCFQCMIFMCETYEPMNEWTSHDFHINLSHTKFVMI
jgi:hypothetical protein